MATFLEKVGKYTNADDIVASTGMDNMEAAILVDKMRYESSEKKEDLSIYPNEYWSEQDILNLI